MDKRSGPLCGPRVLLTALALGTALVQTASAAGPDTLQLAMGEEVGAQAEAAASQQRVNNVDDERQKLLSEFRHVTSETESLKTYNDQLAEQIPSQLEEMESLQKQMQEIETTQREVVPLMQRMLTGLQQFVALDVPFLPEERQRRVENLQAMMARADVTVSEKFRRLLEAYQIEMDYGRTIEAYEGRMGEGDGARTVQFLRVGRVVLMYQTPDREETGYWDAKNKAWVVDNDYEGAFEKNLAVAKKIGAPDLLIVPVPAPTKVDS